MTVQQFIDFIKENNISMDMEISLNITDGWGSSSIDYSSDVRVVRHPEGDDLVLLIK